MFLWYFSTLSIGIFSKVEFKFQIEILKNSLRLSIYCTFHNPFHSMVKLNKVFPKFLVI